MQHTMLKPICLAVAMAALSGCASQHLKTQDLDQKFEAAKLAAAQFPDASQSSNLNLFELRRDSIYLPRQVVPLAPDKALPGVFSDPKKFSATLVSSEGRVNLSTLAERLTKMTGIPVEISPDVYLRTASVSGQANLAFDQERPISFDYDGPLHRYLDLVCSRIGVSWEFDGTRIHFFRWKSQTWEIKALGGKKTLSSHFSSSGSVAAGGKEGSSSSQMSVSQRQESTLDLWGALQDQLKKIMGEGADGRLSINQYLGTVTVQDTPQKLRVINQFIEEQNRRASRSVFFDVKFYKLTEKDNKEAGLDIAGLLTSPNGSYRFFSTPIASLAQSAGGLTGVVLPSEMAAGFTPSLANPGNVGDAVKNGMNTQAVLKAINQVATIAESSQYRVWTVNNEPAPLTIATTQEYVRSVGSTASQTSTATTVDQGSVTSGLVMRLTPRIFDNNELMLEFTLDLSNLEKFDVTQVGNTAVKSATQPRQAGTNIVKMKAGETFVLSQTIRDSESGQGAVGVLGASRASAKQRESLLVMITPVLQQGE